MRSLVLCLLASALATSAAAATNSAQASAWVPDPSRSEVGFIIDHLGMAKVHGRFTSIAGKLLLDPADTSRSSANITIDVASIDTGSSSRDTVLKSSSFFDVSQFPKAQFTSTSVARTADGFAVTGNLTLHGVTRAVVLKVEAPNGPVNGMDHKPLAGFSAQATLNRADFGIGSAFPNAVVGDAVHLNVDLEVIQP